MDQHVLWEVNVLQRIVRVVFVAIRAVLSVLVNTGEDVLAERVRLFIILGMV